MPPKAKKSQVGPGKPLDNVPEKTIPEAAQTNVERDKFVSAKAEWEPEQDKFVSAKAEWEPEQDKFVSVQDHWEPEHDNNNKLNEGKADEDNATSDPPPSCKKCFQKFAERKSMVCPHEFCGECWETMVDLPLGQEKEKKKKQKGSEEDLKGNQSMFTCAVCGASNRSTRPKSAYPVKQVEILGKDVKKAKTFKVILKRVKLFPDAMTWSPTGELILVDCSMKEILILSGDGEVKKHFPYLRNHTFQGGLTVDQEGLIRVALKNDRFSGVSYYTPTGQFKYSAFLYDESPQVGDIVGLDMDELGNMVVLDKESRNICYVSKAKRVESHPFVFGKTDAASDNGGEGQEPVTNKENSAGKDESNGVVMVSEVEVKPQDNDNAGNGDGTGVNEDHKSGGSSEHGPKKPASSNVSKDGLTSIAVNSWRQVLVCDQSTSCIYTNEKQEHYDVEVGRVDLSDKVKATSEKIPVLKAIVDEHDNILVLDRGENRVLRYTSGGQYLDTLVCFPVKSTEVSDEDDLDDIVGYSLVDISSNMKGMLCIMYCREQGIDTEDSTASLTASDPSVTLAKRTEVSLYSYSTPRKHRRKERKVEKKKESERDKANGDAAEEKKKCCVIL